MAVLKAWPAGIPQVAAWGGFAEAPQEDLLVFEPEVGEPLTRPRTTGEIRQIDARMPPMTAAQYVIFNDWFRVELTRGSLRFLWRHPVTGALGRFKFLAKPSWTDNAPYYVLSVKVMQLPGRVTLTGFSQTTPTELGAGSGAITLPLPTAAGAGSSA